ncbi:hypothetical protein PIB30_087304 [Stylosanthes scabra]|uniref:Uncharacterized protein n=1 Tax=Stylosanthes scabra TaxID=79078 RepID=A0ABU6WT76_9FABA|nr:hypothetical protein [Stylosanthes scabra]
MTKLFPSDEVDGKSDGNINTPKRTDANLNISSKSSHRPHVLATIVVVEEAPRRLAVVVHGVQWRLHACHLPRPSSTAAVHLPRLRAVSPSKCLADCSPPPLHHCHHRRATASQAIGMSSIHGLCVMDATVPSLRFWMYDMFHDEPGGSEGFSRCLCSKCHLLKWIGYEEMTLHLIPYRLRQKDDVRLIRKWHHYFPTIVLLELLVVLVDIGGSSASEDGLDTQSSGAVGTNIRRLMVDLNKSLKGSVDESDSDVNAPPEGTGEEDFGSHEMYMVRDPAMHSYHPDSDGEEIEVEPVNVDVVDEEETNYFTHGQPALTQPALIKFKQV